MFASYHLIKILNKKIFLKKVSLFSFFILYIACCYAQQNVTGSYSYILKTNGNLVQEKKKVAPGGTLVLIKIEGNKYRFWLDVLNGSPEYNRGETDGTITFKNDTASFDNTFEEATSDCILKFKRTGNTIEISSSSSSYNCGFDNGINADGRYTRTDKQEPLNNDWLKKQYPDASILKIASRGAELYEDEDGLRSFTKKKLLAKGELIISISETEKTVYTEMIKNDGTLQYGWIRKTAIEMNE